MDDAAERLHLVICEPDLIDSISERVAINSPFLVAGYGLAWVRLPSPEIIQKSFEGSIFSVLHKFPRHSGRLYVTQTHIRCEAQPDHGERH